MSPPDASRQNIPEESNIPMQLKQRESKPQKNINDEFRSIFGDQTYMNFGLESGYINGNTTYQFNFNNGYSLGGESESELKWPLSNSLIGIGTSFNYRLNKAKDDMRDRARLDFVWFTRLNEKSGRVRDSDWIENDSGYLDVPVVDHPGKDIYSETVGNVDSLNIFDVSYTYNFWPHRNWAIGPLFGYRHQQFNFQSHSLEQIGYGPYDSSDFNYVDTQDLKWGLYEAKYSIPYLGLSSQFLWQEKFYLLFNFGFSDWVKVKDKDTHLYPTRTDGLNMVSKGSTEGFAYLYNFQGGWRFDQNWILSLGATFVNLATKGEVTEYFYNFGELSGYTDPASHKVTSRYWLIDLALRYHF